MSKLSLTDLASLQNETTAIAAINSNNAAIITATDNTLSRDGTSPNTMGAILDMNSNQIINLPAPSTVNSPARLIDVASNPTITVPGTGTSGHVVPFLDGNNTWSGTNTFSGTTTITLANNSITGAKLVNNTVGNTQLRQGSARTVIGVTGNATANVADIQGTTRQILAVDTAGTSLVFAQPRGDQLLGTATNDSATAGNVGELISSTVAFGSPVSLVTGTPKTITSISLTAGDWDLSGCLGLTGGSTTTVTQVYGSYNLTTNTVGFAGDGTAICSQYASFTPFNTTSGSLILCMPTTRVSLSSTTTYFLTTQVVFATSTCSGFGTISARRVR